MTAQPDVAELMAMLKAQQERFEAQQKQNDLFTQQLKQLLAAKGDAHEPVNLAGESPPSLRRSPRIKQKNKQVKARVKREQNDGTPLRRSLSFEDAVVGSGQKRTRKSKSEKMRTLRKNLSRNLEVHQDDVMDGYLWDDKKGGLQLECVVCLLVCVLFYFLTCFCLLVLSANFNKSAILLLKKLSARTTVTTKDRRKRSRCARK